MVLSRRSLRTRTTDAECADDKQEKVHRSWRSWCPAGTARWAIQAMLCAGITSLLVVITPVNALFDGSGYWAVQSAVVVIEGTTGASLKKSFERVCGTVAGGFGAYAFYILLTWNEAFTKHVVAQVLLCIFIFLWPLPWGYVRIKFPMNPLIATYGTFTGYLVIIASFLHGRAFRVVVVRVLAVTIGVLVSTAVVHCVWPNSARETLDKRLAELMRRVADILDPLVEIEAGFLQTNTDISKGWGAVSTQLHTIAAKRRQLQGEKPRRLNKAKGVDNGAYEGRPAIQELAAGGADKEARKQSCCEVPKNPLHQYPNESVAASTPDHSGGDASTSLSESGNLRPLGPIDTLQLTNHAGAPVARESLSSLESGSGFQEGLQPLALKTRDLNNSVLSEPKARKRTCSSVSRWSSFFREQEDALEVLHAKTLMDVEETYRHALKVDAAARQHRWKVTLKNFQQCQSLLTDLSGLVTAAKQEVSCRSYKAGGSRVGFFPEKKYTALLAHVERLFHHIASLFFSIDLQQEQTEQARHDSITVALALGCENVDRMNQTPVAENPSKPAETGFPVFDRLASYRKSDPQIPHNLIAGVTAAFIFTNVFGTLVHGILETTRSALTALATALLHHSDTAEARRAITSAADQINSLQCLRAERRAIYAQIFTAAADADAAGHWIERKRSDFGVVNADRSYTTLPWDTLMGLEAETFRRMTKAEHELYWESYWHARDRLSVATATLMLLRDQLYIILREIEDINSCYTRG